MKKPTPTLNRKMIFFLRPVHACIIKRILEGYANEIKDAEENGDRRVSDLLAEGAKREFDRQLSKQFTDEDLEDVCQDMQIIKILNCDKQ